jgi:hypothetical protein
MSKMNSHIPFEYLKHKLRLNERLGVKMSIWLPTIKSQNSLIYLHSSGMPHIIGKLSMRNITLIWTSPQLKVYTKSYGLPKLRKIQFQEFRDSQLGIPGQNDIWMQSLWLITDNTVSKEGDGFLQIWTVLNLVNTCVHVAHSCTENVSTIHYPTCCLVCTGPCE